MESRHSAVFSEESTEDSFQDEKCGCDGGEKPVNKEDTTREAERCPSEVQKEEESDEHVIASSSNSASKCGKRKYSQSFCNAVQEEDLAQKFRKTDSGPLQSNSDKTLKNMSAGAGNSKPLSKKHELRQYEEQLRTLIPGAGELSRLNLIHSAIDYISDLEEALQAKAKKQTQSSLPRVPLSQLPGGVEDPLLRVQQRPPHPVQDDFIKRVRSAFMEALEEQEVAKGDPEECELSFKSLFMLPDRTASSVNEDGDVSKESASAQSEPVNDTEKKT